MNTSCSSVWKQAEARQLSSVLAGIADQSQIEQVLRDVMTQSEIEEVSMRLEAARLLDQGETYTTVIAKTKLSSRTVARISDWMKNGCGGYKVALSRLQTADSHISPVGAD